MQEQVVVLRKLILLIDKFVWQQSVDPIRTEQILFKHQDETKNFINALIESIATTN